MTTKYFVVDLEDQTAVGNAFEKAYDWYKNNIDCDPITDCTFYKAELVEIEVIVKILPKIVEKKNK